MVKENNLNRNNQPARKASGVIDLKKIAQEKKIQISEASKKETKTPITIKPVEDKTVFWWSANNESRTKKSPLWYLTVGVIILALIIFAITQKNWLFLIFIILAIATYISSSINKDTKRTYRISQAGVTVDEKLFYFQDLKSFSLSERRGEKLLIFETSRISEKYLIIPFKKDEEKIVAFVKKYLSEKEYQESFFDTLKDYLGF
jgi:hypothetical protein